MGNININIFLSTGLMLAISQWGQAPLTPILVELFIELQVSSYMKVTMTTGTITSPLCRSVFPSMYQYTKKCVLRTAVITSFISRYSSVKCSSSKPHFRKSLYVKLWAQNETFKFIISSNINYAFHLHKRNIYVDVNVAVNVAQFSEYSFMNINTKLKIDKILYLTVA
jgi:hypothetical protein